MSRLAPKITMAEFKDRMKEFMVDEWFPANFSEKIVKDLSKIDFDWENYEHDTGEGYLNYPCGFKTLKNGLPVLFVNAGGDWECPICICFYFDGKEIRAYIPKDGNVYNKKEKCAYGSEEDDENGGYRELDEAYWEKVRKEEGDAKAIENDIINRIKIVDMPVKPMPEIKVPEIKLSKPKPKKSIEQLEAEIKIAIDAENYEKAAKIRDEINNIKNNEHK